MKIRLRHLKQIRCKHAVRIAAIIRISASGLGIYDCGVGVGQACGKHAASVRIAVRDRPSGGGVEAQKRGLDAGIFAPFQEVPEPAVALRLLALLTWADLTASPTGEEVSVQQRLAEILRRYPPASHVTAHRDWLLTAGSHPLGVGAGSKQGWAGC